MLPIRPCLLLLIGLPLVSCARPLDPEEEETAPDAGIVSCSDDTACGGGFCQLGLCVASECVTKLECSTSEVCVEGRCAPPPAQCTSPEDCPGAGLCDGFTRACVLPDGSEGEGEENPPPSGQAIELGGYILQNRDNDQDWELPGGTTLRPREILLIVRNSPRAAFEDRNGPLADEVRYVDTETEGGGAVNVNGAERFALVDPTGAVVDGTTIIGKEGKSYQRIDAGAASDSDHWRELSADEATPGTVDLPASGVGLVISEWSDGGEGGSSFEFVEIYYAP